MTYPTIFRKALVAVQNSAAAMSPALFGLRSGTNVMASAQAAAAGNDGLIGGIGSTVATAMMLLA
jgi:hypothetical protein